MNSQPRQFPPMNTDERTTLEGWLDFHRETLAMKCEGLDDTQAATPAAPPSDLTLLGLVQHLTEVERNWFRRVLAAEDAPPLFAPGEGHHDGGFEVAAGAGLSDALARWRSEVEAARRNCVGRELTDTGRLGDYEINLRSIYVHLIEEYARHNGHADLLRERLDGTTGV